MEQLSKKNKKFTIKNNKILNFDVQISDLKTLNPNLTLAKCRVFYIGENRNGSFITQECADDMVQQLSYCPVFGEWVEDKDNFGGHGGKIEISDDGIKFIDTTIVYGCAMDESTWYEDVIEDDGTTHTYLCCYLVLFTGKFPELQKIVENGSWESMEIECTETEEKDGLTYVNKAVFMGLCILGKDKENPNNNTEPCFESSDIEVLKEQFALIKNQFKKEFSQVSFVKKEDMGTGDKIEVDLSKDSADMNTSWGSINKTSLRNKILKASNYKACAKACYLVLEDGWEDNPSEKLKFPVCLIKDDKLVLSAKGCESALSFLEKNTTESYYSSAKSKLKKYYKKLGLDTSNFEKEDYIMTKKEIASKFTLTYEQLEDEIRKNLRTLTYVCDDWYGEPYECRKYWLEDYDDIFVYAYDCEQDIYVKLSYAKQGDDVIIDFTSALRVKFSPVDWEGASEGDETVEDDIDAMGEMEMALKEKYMAKAEIIVSTKVTEAVTAKETELNTNFKKTLVDSKADFEVKLAEKDTMLLEKESSIADLTEKFNKSDEIIKTLEAYKLQKETDAKEAVFSEYAEELTEEEVKPVKDKITEFSLEEVETKLQLLFAKKNHKPTKNSLSKYNNMGLEQLSFKKTKDNDETKPVTNSWDKLENIINK